MTVLNAPGAAGGGGPETGRGGPETAGGAGPDDRGPGGPPGWVAILGIGGLLVGVLLIAVQSLGIGVRVGTPTATIAPAGSEAGLTRALVAKALTDASIQVVVDPQVPYRPGESPALASVPRVLLQAVIPSAATAGYVVIYELTDNVTADQVGRDFARYLATGTGAIQYPRDAQFVLRRVGRTLVFFPWSSQVTPDPSVPIIAGILGAIGEAVPAS
jgi:hypothetical protein